MDKKITLKWLGQSGFLLETEDTVIASDLYLSDFCQKKSKLDHTRMAAIPVAPEKLDFIDHYLISHGHIDHFDPETVGPVLQANKQTKFWAPPVCESVIQEYLPGENDRFSLINSEKSYPLTEKIKLIALPAAHEELEKDANGEYISFSYLILFENNKQAVFFGGDTVPYSGHAEKIKKHLPHDYELSMVLPVNGRDKKRADLGFKGNMSLSEAIDLANACGAAYLIPCHYGMFALNDIPETMDAKAFAKFNGKEVIPEINSKIQL